MAPSADNRLDTKFIDSIEVSDTEVTRTCEKLSFLPPVSGRDRISLFLNIARWVDLTSLNGDDSDLTIISLCSRAQRPIQVGSRAPDLTVAGVCVYPVFVPLVQRELKGSDIRVGTVAGGFPHGLSPLKTRLDEVAECIALGADEIEIVIRRDHVFNERWKELHAEVKAMKEACQGKKLKAILATGELGNMTNIAKASHVAMMAGADFIKTSTGKESTNATPAAVLTMARCIKQHHERTGKKIGLKPTGGVARAKQAVDYVNIVREVLGEEWLDPRWFRFGASRLLDDLETMLPRR